MEKMAFYNFEANFTLYKNDYESKVSIYPKSSEEALEEENATMLLKYILKETNKLKLLQASSTSTAEIFLEKFKTSAYLNRLGEINFPISGEVYSLLEQILTVSKDIYQG